jgi:hypothetical protein
MHTKQIDKSYKGVEPLSKRTLHLVATNDLTYKPLIGYGTKKKSNEREGEIYLELQIVYIMEIGGYLQY